MTLALCVELNVAMVVAHLLSASVQEVLIVPLLPMALVALDEMERNASPLYRYGPAGVEGEACLGRVSAAAVFSPAQLSGGGTGQPEGFQDEHVHPSPQRSLHVGAGGHVVCGDTAAEDG